MMNQRIPVVLTLLNLLLLCGLALDRVRPAFAKQNSSPVLRGRALEIVDAQGRLRATIGVLPSTTVDSKRYPETVLLRLGLTDGADRGVQVFAHDTGSFIRIVDRAGRERVIRP
ncbi:MAG: hypothetical protein DMD72_08265 [Gemmatimonadetes bacterium]|nr:MAG: hypothetical protein DMD72_08265 [Gemmatimonadota bacterium]